MEEGENQQQINMEAEHDRDQEEQEKQKELCKLVDEKENKSYICERINPINPYKPKGPSNRGFKEIGTERQWTDWKISQAGMKSWKISGK